MYTNNDDSQLWRFENDRFISKSNGLVLSIKEGESGIGATVIMLAESANDNGQTFRYIDVENEITSIRDDTALQVRDGIMNNGTEVQMYERDGNTAQKWRQIYYGNVYNYCKIQCGKMVFFQGNYKHALSSLTCVAGLLMKN